MHLTQDEIERYVRRSATVDEIIAFAEHLEDCSECRDRAAALVDNGTGEIMHTSWSAGTTPVGVKRGIGVVGWFAIIAAIAVAVAVFLLVQSK